jgi:hypothetical protein
MLFLLYLIFVGIPPDTALVTKRDWCDSQPNFLSSNSDPCTEVTEVAQMPRLDCAAVP